MRIRVSKFITICVLVLNSIAVYLVWKFVSSHSKYPTKYASNRTSNLSDKNNIWISSIDHLIQKNVTVLIRAFEQFENDIPDTVKSIVSLYPDINVLIISDLPLYPPITLNNSSPFKNVKFITLESALGNSFEDRTPLFQIKGNYVLFAPDSTRFARQPLEKLVKSFINDSDKLLSLPLKTKSTVRCLKLQLNVKEWVIRFDDNSEEETCDFVKGKHITLLKTEVLKILPDPFMLPFPDAFYVQAATKNIKVRLLRDAHISNGRDLFVGHHNQWKVQQLERERQQAMFKHLSLKKVIRETGVVEWFGCRKDTPRCFSSVVDDTPQYLWEGKWTPPCCLAALRRTARHVFEQLEQAKVRYWLEGGSLLGAIRGGDILPWDYDVDVGIYRDDFTKCSWLMRAKGKPTVDDQGFVWEKAIEGDFYRVQFSRINRLHVDIFPFHSRNGTMTKDTWFKSHRQDREFPEHFLKPLSNIDFVGRTVSAPNNIHDFLELKFGEGVVENPEYPNPLKLAMRDQVRFST